MTSPTSWAVLRRRLQMYIGSGGAIVLAVAVLLVMVGAIILAVTARWADALLFTVAGAAVVVGLLACLLAGRSVSLQFRALKEIQSALGGQGAASGGEGNPILAQYGYLLSQPPSQPNDRTTALLEMIVRGSFVDPGIPSEDEPEPLSAGGSTAPTSQGEGPGLRPMDR